MNKTDYYIMRRAKKIKLKDIAEHIGCSIGLLSKYENNLIDMDIKKVRLYKEFIINK